MASLKSELASASKPKRKKTALKKGTRKIPKKTKIPVIATTGQTDGLDQAGGFIGALKDFSRERQEESPMPKKLNLNVHRLHVPGKDISPFRMAAPRPMENYLAKAKEVMARDSQGGARTPFAKMGLYKKIALTFIFLVLVLLGVVFYFSFVRIKVIIVPSQEKIADNLVFKVTGLPANPGSGGAEINGLTDKFNVVSEKTFDATGERVISEDVRGKITIYNKYIKNQPLVASTRILSADGKLFRTKETVNVPAGGEVQVEVYADKSDASMVIGPGKFTIPGLWAGLQDKIYGESTQAMSYQKEAKKFIKEEDIQKGMSEVKAELASLAQSQAKAKYPQYDTVVFKIDESQLKEEISAKANEEKDNFTVKIEAPLIMAAFNSSDSIALIKDKFSLTIPEGKELINFDSNSIKYQLEETNLDTGQAEIKADFSGQAAVKAGSKILDPKDLAGLTRAQLEEYLKSKDEIADFEIKFYPSLVKRVPALLDRIEIEVLK
jgi:hypothetical protein